MGKVDLSWLFKPGVLPDFHLTDQKRSKQLIKEKLFCFYKDGWLNSALGRFKLEMEPKPNVIFRINMECEDLRSSTLKSKLLMPSEKLPFPLSFFQ